MRSIFIKSLVISILSLVISQFSVADSCSDPSRQQDICREMKHLRSQILVLGAERDLMQINYNLMGLVGEEIKAGASRALSKLSVTDENHGAGLIGVQAIAIDLIEQSKQKNGDALMTANKIQQQCATCHNSVSPNSGYKWDDIFKSDWSVFYKKCNSSDRNPYRCKSMHGMFSYYSGFFTANQLGLQNYELTELEAQRISTIASTLKENNLIHGLEDMIEKVAVEASVVSQLAAKKDPEAFERAMTLTQSCMSCHADRPMGVMRPSIRLKPLSR